MHRRLPQSKVFSLSLAATSLALAGCTATEDSSISATSSPQDVVVAEAALSSELTVFRNPTCGCCGQWIERAKVAGFQVKDKITEDMSAIKQQYGVPQSLTSCHTTVVGGYAIEGHILAEDVQRLLTEKPDVAGIAVPEMPIGSPGMESGDYRESYTAFSFTESGETVAFAEHS